MELKNSTNVPCKTLFLICSNMLTSRAKTSSQKKKKCRHFDLISFNDVLQDHSPTIAPNCIIWWLEPKKLNHGMVIQVVFLFYASHKRY